MKTWHTSVAVLLTMAVLYQLSPFAKACGPESIQPIFVMQDSPDPPFREFTQGKIGILKPTFGRKTLVIAYHYLNGGSFNEEEQNALIEALKGTGPEPDTEGKIKEWIAARKLVVKDEDELPVIYRESRFGNYDFFPNCTSNAFEVAIETLKDRAASFGADNNDVHEWLSGQDTVFRNCSDTAAIPITVGAERPEWLRKDRDYQIAASFFYSLQFDEAVKRFEQISQDNESSWQSLADYLVGRTLVRQASLERDEPSKLKANQKAEGYLVGLNSRAGKYRDASRKLLALIKYRLHPEERVRELAQTLNQQSASVDLRQDLIDYVWLLDKFDRQVQKQEEERQKLLNPPKEGSENEDSSPARTQETNYEPPPEIDIRIYNLTAARQLDYATGQTFSFKPETSLPEIMKSIETSLGRKLTDEDTRQIKEQHEMALHWRRFQRSPNRKLTTNEYEGCDYDCKSVPLSLYPTFLRVDELSDWILTFQSKDPQAYSHALQRWRDTQSPSWFVTSFVKANKTSPSLSRLLSHAEQIQPDMPMYATVAYNRIRLLTELGRESEARQLLNQIIESGLDTFPVSAQNEFLEERMNVAEGLSAFLRFALRKPVVFYEYGQLGTIKDILGDEEDYQDVAEQERDEVKRLLEWDGRSIFDERVADILNWHFSLTTFMKVARDPAVPTYIRERVLLASWTRAILLKRDVIAREAAVEIARTTRDNPALFQAYLNAHTAAEREAAATFALLKLPYLSPYVSEGVPDIYMGEDGFDLALAWWCVLPQTVYDEELKEKPKQVFSPRFLTPELLSAAEKERGEIIALGDAKSFLGKKAIQWAKLNPGDSRVPEALFIAVRANESYKYGCHGWENDDKLRQEAASLLIEKYPNSAWAVKLQEIEQ